MQLCNIIMLPADFVNMFMEENGVPISPDEKADSINRNVKIWKELLNINIL